MHATSRQRLGKLHRRLASTMHEFLGELATFDDTQEWRTDGATDAVSWLSHELGLSRATARHWLEVAHKLESFPLIAAEIAAGHVSIDQARPLMRLAALTVEAAPPVAPENDRDDGARPDARLASDVEAEIVDLAAHHTVAELQRLARRTRQVPRSEEAADREQADVDTWWDEHHRFLHLSAKLPGVDGATVEYALRRLASSQPLDPETGQFNDPGQRMAEALVQMASESLGGDSDPDRATIVVHVEHTALTGDGTGHLPAGPALAAETIRRLGCDARLQVVATADGRPVGVGRTTRTVPPWLRRLVVERDEGCRFPGCGRTRWLHIHHIAHWAHGGPTDLANLVALCGYHHRMLHREGWRIGGDVDTVLEWVRPEGHRKWPLRIADDDPDPVPVPRGLRSFDLRTRLAMLEDAFTAAWGPPPAPPGDPQMVTGAVRRRRAPGVG